MKLALISTYLPKHCGIATYTGYLIRGIKKADSALEIKIIAEQGASPLKQDKLEVVPCWDRNENYVEPVISHTKGVDVAHIQHEYYTHAALFPAMTSGENCDLQCENTLIFN